MGFTDISMGDKKKVCFRSHHARTENLALATAGKTVSITESWTTVFLAKHHEFKVISNLDTALKTHCNSMSAKLLSNANLTQ